MAAFEAAVTLGYRYVETDAHATADGAVVAFHDDNLDRVTDGRGRIADLAWREVAAARVRPPSGSAEPAAPIVRLEELLGAWRDLRVNIDPKHDAVVEPLIDVLRRTGALDRVCIGAFSDRRLARVRRLTGGRACTSLGPVDVARLRVASVGVPVGRVAAGCAQVPVSVRGRRLVDRRFLAAAHARGLAVHVWTIDAPEEMDALLDLGVDGIMTDRPALLKDVLVRRGQWVAPAG